MSEAVSHERPSLPASTSAFDLPASSRTASADELNPFMLHLHKPSLLNPKLSHLSRSQGEKRHQSPLATSFTHRRRVSLSNGEDSESDKDSKVWASDRSSSLSSGNVTPPQPDVSGASPGLDIDAQMKLVGGLSSASSSLAAAAAAAGQQRVPYTPPRKLSMDMEQLPSRRRLSLPVSPPSD
jgi:hypothetical protein